jgi:hypothetical protein
MSDILPPAVNEPTPKVVNTAAVPTVAKTPVLAAKPVARPIPAKAGAVQAAAISLPKIFTMSQLRLKPRSRVLAIGEPGTGKTVFGLMMPSPLIFDMDNNIVGPINFLQKQGLLTQAQMDDTVIVNPFLDENGDLQPRINRWRALTRTLTFVFKEIKEGRMAPRKTLFLDSLTALATAAMDEVRRQEGKTIGDVMSDKTQDEQFTLPDFGRLASLLSQFFIALGAYDMHLYVSAHTQDIERDDKSTKTFIACPGSFKEAVSGMFTEAWKFTRESSGPPGQLVDKCFIQTVGGNKLQKLGLKSALQLGSRLEVDLKKVKEIFQ